MVDRIVLVGAGRTSASIVERLARIAPLTIVDTSQSALDHAAARAAGTGEEGASHPVTLRAGDGTSRLVLEDLRGDAASEVGLVVTTGDDRMALETCRLAGPLSYRPVIAVVNDPSVAGACEEAGARALVRAQLVSELVEQYVQQGAIAMGGTAGFGRGEIVEFRVLPSSPAIGVPLADLRAHGWRIAAIYRGTELVLPVGTAAIAADDRVLVVGDARQLPHVAESLRVGHPTFPLLHGPHVVLYLPSEDDRRIADEAELVALRTRAARLVRVSAGAAAARETVDAPGGSGAGRKVIEDAPLTGSTLEGHLTSIRGSKPGVVVVRARPRSVGDLLLGRGGRDAVICNEVGVPVLFPKGNAEYARVVLGVTEGSADFGTAEVALDLARMFKVPFVVQRVTVPSYLMAAAPETDQLVETIEHRARLHDVVAAIERLDGNPIGQWTKASRPADLLVVARPTSLRDSFSRPDLALRMARQSKGSVLVVTVRA